MTINFDPIRNIKTEQPFTNEKFKKGINSLVTNNNFEEIDEKTSSETIKNNYNQHREHRPTNICGTENFIPIDNHQQMAKELAALKDENGNPLFEKASIEYILEDHSDTTELSLALDLLLKSKIKIKKFDLEQLLSKENISYSTLKKRISTLKEIKANPIFENLIQKYKEESLVYEILCSQESVNTSQAEKNIEHLEKFKQTHPNIYEKFNNIEHYFDLRFTFDTKINEESLSKILDTFFDETINSQVFHGLLKTDLPKEEIDRNIKFLNELKNESQLSFLFDKENGLKEWDILNILSNKLPKNIDLKEKKEIINLLEYAYQNPSLKSLILHDPKTSVSLLKKDTDDNYSDGKKLIDLISNSNLIYQNLNKLLTTCSFKDSYELLNSYIKNEKIEQNCSSIINLANGNNINIAKNLLEMLDYATTKDLLKDEVRLLCNCSQKFLYENDEEMPLWVQNKEEYKKKIDELEEIANSLPKDIWNYFKSPIISDFFTDKNTILKDNNIEYFNELLKKEELKSFLNYTDPSEVIKHLSQEVNIEKLKQNQDKVIELINYSNKINEHLPISILFFDGNIEKLLEEYKNTTSKDYGYISVKLNKDNQNITFSCYQNDTPVEKMYDKEMNEIYIQKMYTSPDYKSSVIKITDKKNNSKHTMTIKQVCSESLIPTKITSQYFDENNNMLKTKMYNESGQNGIVSIKQLTPDGKIKTISSSYTNQFGSFVKKELESIDGTKSYITSNKDVNGNENYSYIIKDKDGKELLNHQRTTKIIDKNTKITSVNGQEYKVIKNKNSIEVINYKNNKKTIIDLDQICPERSLTLEKTLFELPGDELLKLNKYVKICTYTNSINSSFNSRKREINAGPSSFVFLHELGHAKDLYKEIWYNKTNEKGQISGDKKLQKIFIEELNNFKGKESQCIQEVLNYFIQGENEHYSGQLGGLQEIVAETNAIQSTVKTHPLLEMRTQLLQEHFPKTIAYIISNHLLSC